MNTLLRFLRYNSCHHLLGLKTGRIQLDPISSCSSDTRWQVYEPVWLFQLRQRAFAFAGRHRCGQRQTLSGGARPDTWDLGPDGHRTCSYCGSMHPDDFMAHCRRVIDCENNSVSVETTDKAYKVYVTQPGVRNACEGAIKFYMHHAPEQPTAEEQRVFSEAIKVSVKRYHERMALRAAIRS